MTLKRPLATGDRITTDVATFGESSLDLVGTLAPGSPFAGKQSLETFARYVGGQAATAAVACVRQGIRARFIGAFGRDEWGAVVQAALRDEGVDVRAVDCPQADSRVAVVLVDPAGERMVYEHRHPGLRLIDPAPAVEAATSAAILAVDATDVPAAVVLATAARRAGVRTIVDVDRPVPGLGALLALIDVIIAPAPFVCAWTGAAELGDGLARLASDFDAEAVVGTMGPDGSLARAAGIEIRTPGFSLAVKDTTGAGDAFRGGFASAWIRGGTGVSLGEVLLAANATAALNCRAIGAQTALPSLREVQALVTTSGPVRSK